MFSTLYAYEMLRSEVGVKQDCSHYIILMCTVYVSRSTQKHKIILRVYFAVQQCPRTTRLRG